MEENAAQVYARLGSRDSMGKLDVSFTRRLGLSIKLGDVIELRGAEGCAKTEMLLNVAATYMRLCASSEQSVHVVFVSADYKFDVSRLTTIVENQVMMNCTNLSESDSIILSVLSRMQVFFCNSVDDLSHVLLSLHTYLSSNPQICVLMIDNVANFYWSQINEEHGCCWKLNEQRQPTWTTALQELIDQHQLVVFATRSMLMRDMTGCTVPSLHLESNEKWQKMVNYKVFLQKVVAKQNTFCASLSPQGLSFAFTVSDIGIELV